MANSMDIRYKQQKYNLMREEINGYSSLVNDLTSLSIDNERDDKGKLTPTPLTKIPEFLNIMTSRIGEFYLDPNRVLDIILTFLVEQISVNYKFWVELIKQSGWVEEHVTSDSETIKCSTILAQLIGFKFFNHHVCIFFEKEYSIETHLVMNLGIFGTSTQTIIPCDRHSVKKQCHFAR